MIRTHLKRPIIAAVALSLAMFGSVAPSLAFRSGDVPAPVDFTDNAGPGQSHTNSSGKSGFDGNQGNGKLVGNAGGPPPAPAPAVPPTPVPPAPVTTDPVITDPVITPPVTAPEVPEDGGAESPGELIGMQ